MESTVRKTEQSRKAEYQDLILIPIAFKLELYHYVPKVGVYGEVLLLRKF